MNAARLLLTLVAVLMSCAYGPAYALAITEGLQGFATLGPALADTGNINTATVFTMNNVVSNAAQTGYFMGLPSFSTAGSWSFTTTVGSSLTFSNPAFGTFQSSTITTESNAPGFRAFYVLGTLTGGMLGPVSPSPAPAGVTISLTQFGSAISSSATLSLPARPGLSPENPLMPDSVLVPPGDEQPPVFQFTDPLPRRWFDPPLVSEYELSLTGGSASFLEVGIPSTFGTADIFEFSGGSWSDIGDVSATSHFVFTNPGTTKFRIGNITPLADAGDPNGFPVFLDFYGDTAGATFSMNGVVAVPEPSTYAMALAGLACAGLLLRRRRAINSLTVFAFLTVGSVTASQTFAGAITVSPEGVITDGTSQLVAVSGTAPNGNTWASYVTGTNVVAYFDLSTGSLMLDPKGRSLNAFDFRWGTSGTGPGPFVYSTGTGFGCISSSLIERTLPVGSWSSITTSPTRFSGMVSLTISPTLATSGGNIASTNGWFNLPWSFGAIAPSVTTLEQMYSTAADQGFRSPTAGGNLLGYGNGIGMFLWLEAGVAGNQYGAVIPIQPVPEPAAIVLTGLGVATLLVRHTHWHRRRVNESETG